MPVTTPPPPTPTPNPNPVPIVIQNPGETTTNNDLNNRNNSASDSNSESTNISSLSSYQINSNHESTRLRFSNGAELPGTSIYSDFNITGRDYNDSLVYQGSIGIRHTFGGKGKKIIEQGAELDNFARTLSVCQGLGLWDTNKSTQIDYKMLPQLEACQYISQRTILPPPAPVDNSDLIQQIRKENEELKEQNRLFLEKINQLVIEPTAKESSY